MRTKFRKSLRSVVAGSLLFGGAVSAAVIGGATPAWAQSSVTLYVASGGSGDCTSLANACGSLQTALATATGVAYSGDDVTIDVGVGTFDENDIVDAAGLNSLTIDGAGRSSTILDGTESGNVLVISGGTVNISGVAVENGDGGNDGAGIDICDGEAGCVVTVSGSAFTNDDAPAWGGAIDNGDNGGDGTLTVTGSTFIDDNSDGNGGGAINNGANGGAGTVTVSGSTFNGDEAVESGRGGAIDNADNSGSGTVTVSGSTFTDDTADWGGGAISNGSDHGDGSVSVTNSTFSGDEVNQGNSASSGGAIDNGNGSATVSDSTFSNNEANYGGAISGSDNASQGGNGTLTVSGSTFSTNSAIDGGAIDGPDQAGSAGGMTVSDSTFSGNTAASDGGAIDNADNAGDGNATVTSSTFSGNGASISGGAVDNAGNGGSGSASFGASILAGATAGGECAGTITDLGYNIDDGSTCGFASPSLSTTSADLDPSGLQNNGGPTQTIALEGGSPAIGLVTNAPQCPSTDQRGAARPTSGSCDAGAYDTNGTSFDPSVSSVAITGGLIAPTVTVTGSGFGNQADLGAPAPATACSNTNTGSDFDNFSFSEVTAGWGAGGGSNCTGVSITSYSTTQFTFTFGNGYGNGGSPDEYGALGYGDSFDVNMLGTTFNGSVPAYSPTPTISSVAITGSLFNPTVTVTGSGFGTEDDLGSPVPAYCGNTGFDYDNNFSLTDGWGAGLGSGPFGDCTGVSISSYSDTHVTFTFGNGYGNGNGQYGSLSSGDSFQMNVLGADFNGTVPTLPPTIEGVTFGGDPTNPTVTVSGSGFGTLADLGSQSDPDGGGSGWDYGNNFYFSDLSGSWQAGQSPDYVGLVISAYSSTQITFTFGDQYSVFGPVKNDDNFSMALLGTSFNGTASLGTGYTCTVSGISGTNSFPVVVSESPAPPASIDEGGTFQTAPAAQVTVPASVLDHFIGMGATSLTIASQSTTLDGRSSVGGALSGAVSPNTESAAATDLPQSDSLVADTPYTYSTTYNPVTWQTGPGTGKVYLTPGEIDAEVTFVIHGTATPESISCTPPSGVAALGSTTVASPPPSPTFQVPAATPALQNQVTAGTDGGWGATIANTSTATVTGLNATVTVTDGGAPLSYDLAGMAASGTTCATAGSGKVTCSLKNLAVGASDALDVLVTTSGLGTGTSITGSATITSSNQTGHTSLGSIGVVVVQSGNSAKAVAVPGIAVTSTKRPLKTAKASVTLTLPNKKIRKSAADRVGAQLLTFPLAATTLTSPPPVAVTLESLAPSAEPALCPPTGSTKCEGNIIQAVGNFSAYTNKAAPIVAVVKFFYGLHVPTGTVYFLKPNGKTVDKLSVCKKTAGAYDTPCLGAPEQTFGSSAHDSLYVQDTVYFTGNDPAMGRR